MRDGFEREVATTDSPLVVLFGEQSADEARDSGAVREDADDVGPATDLLVQTLLRLLDQI